MPSEPPFVPEQDKAEASCGGATVIDSPAVWRGDELFARPDWNCQLTTDEIDELLHAVTEAKVQDLLPHADWNLPKLSPRLASIQQSLEEGAGATLIRGFPLARLSPDDATRAFWVIAQQIGTPLSQSATGERVFHVCDAGHSPDDPRARGPNTAKRLSFHTDRCDVIAFLCLRPAQSGGENHIVSSATLYNEVRHRRPDLLAQLMRPYYYQRHNVDRGNPVAYCRQPILSFCQGHFAGCFLRVLIERADQSGDVPPMSRQQREALDFLEQVADQRDLHARVRLEPGDILLLNNWVTFHRRTAFVDAVDPARKRHILRIWLSVPNSRPIDPLFEANYGATAAGAIRGGMRSQTS